MKSNRKEKRQTIHRQASKLSAQYWVRNANLTTVNVIWPFDDAIKNVQDCLQCGAQTVVVVVVVVVVTFY